MNNIRSGIFFKAESHIMSFVQSYIKSSSHATYRLTNQTQYRTTIAQQSAARTSSERHSIPDIPIEPPALYPTPPALRVLAHARALDARAGFVHTALKATESIADPVAGLVRTGGAVDGAAYATTAGTNHVAACACCAADYVADLWVMLGGM